MEFYLLKIVGMKILPSFRVVDSADSEITAFSADSGRWVVEREGFLASSIAETTLIFIAPSSISHLE